MRVEFLQNPDLDTLIRAAGDNQREWLARMAVASGGEAIETEAATWTYSPRPKGVATLAFPRYTEANAGEQIDAFLDFCRERRPLRSVSCWTEASGEPQDIGARLVARGYHWGWMAHWMGLDMVGQALEVPATEGVRIGEAAENADWSHPELGEEHLPVAPFYFALSQMRPQRVWIFVATVENRVMGHCILNLTDGPLGVGGLYELGVVDSLRGQKVGLALVHLACRTAREHGARFATLNSINDSFYERLGFRSLGYGQTWWMGERGGVETLRFAPPSPEEIAFVEAVGRGDMATLDKLGGGKTVEQLNTPILGRYMTLMELAVEMKQPASVHWLTEHGVHPPKVR